MSDEPAEPEGDIAWYQAELDACRVELARLKTAEGLILRYATDDLYCWDGDRYEPSELTEAEAALLDSLTDRPS